MEGNPVPHGINHRVMPLGVHWQALMAVLLVSVLLFNWVTKLGAIAFLVISIAVMRWINKKEPRFFSALKLWWRYGRHTFDAGVR